MPFLTLAGPQLSPLERWRLFPFAVPNQQPILMPLPPAQQPPAQQQQQQQQQQPPAQQQQQAQGQSHTTPAFIIHTCPQHTLELSFVTHAANII